VRSVLVIRRIHVDFELQAQEDARTTIEGVHGLFADKCPIYRVLSSPRELKWKKSMRSRADRSEKGDDNPSVDLFSGFIKLHVLHHASEEPIYGLWLIEELAEHGYKVSPGTLYPLLHSLEESELLKSIASSTKERFAATTKLHPVAAGSSRKRTSRSERRDTIADQLWAIEKYSTDLTSIINAGVFA
jgi:hypothetical protein